MSTLYDEREDQIRRLRDLHGALEMSLLLASDALAEAHPTVPSSQWFELLVRQGVQKLEESGRLSGRLAFFTDAEIAELDVATEGTSALGDEIARDYVRRGLLRQEGIGDAAV